MFAGSRFACRRFAAPPVPARYVLSVNSASSASVAGTGLATVTWTPTNGVDKNADVTLSNGNLNAAGINTEALVRATAAATGKFQFEIKLNGATGEPVTWVIIDNGSTDLSTNGVVPGRDNSNGIAIVLRGFGLLMYWGGGSTLQGGFNTASGLWVDGDVLTVEFDTAATTLTLYRNGALMPDTVRGGNSHYTDAPTFSSYRAVVGPGSITSMTANFTGPFVHALAAGFSPYDVSNVTLSYTPANAVAPANASSSSTTSAITLSPKTTLVVANGSSASAADNVTLAAKWALSIANAASASTTDSPTLAPKTTLSVAAALSASTAANLVLAPKTALTVANAASASTLDAPTLALHYALAIANAVSAAANDNVTLAPRTSLSVAGASSASTVTNVAIASRYALVAAAAVSLSTAGSPTLVLAGSLPVNSASSASVADSPTLSPRTSLIVGNASSSSIAGSPVLAPRYVLAPASAVSLSAAGNVSIVPRFQLLPDNLASASVIDGLVLTAHVNTVRLYLRIAA